MGFKIYSHVEGHGQKFKFTAGRWTKQPQCPSGAQCTHFRKTRPKAEFDGTGRTGRTDGEQKCPLIFFIFCGYIDKVYIYLHTKTKLSPTLSWV